jgi:hypothetical protein
MDDDTIVREDGAVIVPIKFSPPDSQETRFERADLIFEGVSHAESSYELRVYLNNTDANAETDRTSQKGYAGKFSIFGHGGCYGGDGHCDIVGAPTGTEAVAMATSLPHPLTPQTKTINITEALNSVLFKNSSELEALTLVPIRKAPRNKDSGPTRNLFSYKRVRLQTYR